MESRNLLAELVKTKRREAKLTQEDFAGKTGVALTVIRKIEQGNQNLNLIKVNQVLKMFGHVLGPIQIRTGESYKKEKL